MSSPFVPSTRPFNLIRYFALAGLGIVVAVALVLWIVSSEFATRNAVEENKLDAMRIAHHLSAQLYGSLLQSRAGSGDRSPLASVRNMAELDAFIQERVSGLNLKRLKILDLDGMVVYSTKASLVGQPAENMTQFRAARDGTSVAALARETERDAAGRETSLTLLQVYVPITRSLQPAQTNSTTGVFEFQFDIGDELQQQIAFANRQAFVTAIGLLTLMFGGLLLVVMRADREIRTTFAQLMAHDQRLASRNKENAQLAAFTRSRRNDEQGALLEFSQALLRTVDPQEVFALSVRTASGLIAGNSATVWQPENGTGHVHLTAAHGWPPDLPVPFDDTQSSLPALIIRRQQVVEMSNAPGEHSFSLGQHLGELNYHAALGAPLRHGEHTLGALVVFRQEAEPFDEDDSRLLTLVANQTAVALDQRRLYQALAERERFAAAMVRLSIAVNATLKLDSVLDIICREAAGAFSATTTIIWQLHGERLVCVASYGYGARDFLGMQQPLDDPELLGARVIRDRKPIYVNHADERNSLVKPPILKLADGKSLLGVPFFQGNQTLGAMVLIDRQQGERYGAEDITRATVLGQQAAIAIHNAQLYERTRQQSSALAKTLEQLESTYDATLAALSRALDARDSETEGHSLRVTAYALELARRLGWNLQRLESLERGALLHDIGKIGIPDSILRKPGILSAAEWKTVREHPLLGEQMLQDIPFLQDALEIVRSHQERYDGSGYPQGLHGDAIPVGARVFAVADAFDAITSDRPYRKARSYADARKEMGAYRGSQFDPLVVDVFAGVAPERWQELREKVAQMPDLRVRTLVLGDERAANEQNGAG